MRNALKMHDPRPWLIQGLQTQSPQSEGKIGVFEIGRRIALIEAAHAQEQGTRDHQGGAGAVVHLSHIVVNRLVGIFVPAEIPAAAVVPDDAAGFLQGAVGIQQLGPDRAHVVSAAEQRQHCVAPAVQHLRVVVQEQQILPARGFRRPVATADEAQIGLVPLQADAFDSGQVGDLLSGEGIIDDDHFQQGRGRMCGDRRETAQGERHLAVSGDDHRDHRRVEARQDQTSGIDRGLEVGCNDGRRDRAAQFPCTQPEAELRVQLQGHGPPNEQDRPPQGLPSPGRALAQRMGKAQSPPHDSVEHRRHAATIR